MHKKKKPWQKEVLDMSCGNHWLIYANYLTFFKKDVIVMLLDNTQSTNT